MAWKQQIGEEIAKARRKVDLTQEDLGKAIGVSRNMIGQYERGDVPPPFEALASIARVLRADQFVVEDLHITFSRNGTNTKPEALPQQLRLDFDQARGVTVRIESVAAGVVIRAVS
jgi:transcriptional regulator with XRE-family HTH domain